MDEPSGSVSKPPRRGKANRRERVSTENVNAGFERLRKLVPTDPIDRKLSKIEVLRLATSYISHLSNLTKASSCAEAQALAKSKDSKSRHICTFCIMRKLKNNAPIDH